MAVEARHLNLFPPQLLGNREMMNPIEASLEMYNTAQMGYRMPVSGTTTATETLPPMYSSVAVDSIPQKTPIKSESGLTYNLPAAMPRKRPRDSSSSIISPPILSYPTLTPPQPNAAKPSTAAPFSFLGHDFSLHLQHHHLDIDRLISQHMEKVRLEIEEKRKSQARRIVEAMEEGVMKRLRAKEEEIEKIGKLNFALEERVRALCIENQILRDLAQTNEATANALRTNLEQVLAAAAQVKDDRTLLGTGLLDDTADDAQSCCGSSGEREEESRREREEGRCTLANEAHDKNGPTTSRSNNNNNGRGGGSSGRVCRSCRKEESCVLLLPCRHLCLCSACGSTLHVCPVCKVAKNASFHVNMSS